MKVVYHPQFFDVDLPAIESLMGIEEFDEFLECLDNALCAIESNPSTEGARLVRPPLDDFRKLKFHSKHVPAKGMKADMRLIYKIDHNKDTLYIAGVGKRRPKEPNDVYAIIEKRVRL